MLLVRISQVIVPADEIKKKKKQLDAGNAKSNIS